MTSTLPLGLALAAASAVALGWGFFAQHGAAGGLPPLSPRRPVASLRLLLANRRWLTGFTVGLAGWAFYVGALALAPLSLVQATAAGGIGLLALLVQRGGAVPPSRAEWTGVALSVVSLALLGVSLAGGGAPGSGAAYASVAAATVGAVLVAGLAAGPGARVLAPGAGFGIASGILYAAGDVGTKSAVQGALAFVPVVLACHGGAFALLQLGFQRGGALATAGLSTLLTNALPIVAGVILFREHVPAGLPGVLRLAGFALAVAGAAVIAARRAPTGAAPA